MEKDLLVKTGYNIDDIGRTLPWSALGAFLHKLDLNSETAREIEPEIAAWAGTMKTNTILADIYDMLATINANMCAIGTRRNVQRPKSYPRPTDKQKERIGKDALPAEELREWFDAKRKQRRDEEHGDD